VNIGIDALPLVRDDGIARFVRNILVGLQQIDHENQYFLFSRAHFALPFESPRWKKQIHRGVPFRLSYASLRTRGRVPALDVFWATGHTFPLGLPAATRKIFTVYDLVWKVCPETMQRENLREFKRFVAKAIAVADKIVTISESTRRGLLDAFKLDPANVRVLYPAPESLFSPLDKGDAAKYIADKYGVSSNYICTVGTIEPRKNIPRLVKAIKLLRDRGGFSHQLLIAGPPGWNCAGIYDCVSQVALTELEVRFLGRVPDEDLRALYAGAALFVYPSIYEGFGIPLVEAMASGAPVVASNAPAIPEVVSDSAVLFSAHSPEDIAEAIRAVLNDAELRRQMVEKGFDRARAFCWEVTAQRMLTVLEEHSRADRHRGELVTLLNLMR